MGQLGVVEPLVTGHTRHEDDQVGRDFAPLGDDLRRFHAFQLMAQVGFDTEPLHALQDALYSPVPEPLARLRRRAEEYDLELVAAPFTAQLRIDSEQELEYRSATHCSRLVGVGGKTAGNDAAFHLPQPVPDRDRGRDTLAGCDGVFDARQLLYEAASGRDDQSIVFDLASIRHHDPSTLLEADGRSAVVVHLHA